MKPEDFLKELADLLKRAGVTEFGACGCCRGTHVVFGGMDYEHLGFALERKEDASGNFAGYTNIGVTMTNQEGVRFEVPLA